MNKVLSFFSLRVLIISLVGLLVGITLFFAIDGLQQNRQAYLNEKQIVEQTRLTNVCLQIAAKLSTEHIQTSMLLLQDGQGNEHTSQSIDQQRQISNQQMRYLLTSLVVQYPNKAQHLIGLWKQIGELRTEFDASYANASLDPSFRWRWKAAVNAITSYLEVLQTEISDISKLPNAQLIDTEVVYLDRTRYLTMHFKKLVQLESGILSDEYQSGQPLGSSTASILKDLRIQSSYFWSELKREIQRSPDDAFQAKIEFHNVENILFNHFYPKQDTLLQQTEKGQYARPEIVAYFDALSAVSEAIYRLEDSLAQADIVHATQRFEKTNRQKMFSIASIIAILLLAVLVEYLLIRRFTRPLHEIMEHINRLKDIGVHSSGEQIPTHGDEFSNVLQALAELDKAIEARYRSEQALHNAEQINSLILAGAPMSIIITSVDGLITMFNPGAETMLKYSAQEATGKDLCMLIFDPEQMKERAEKLSEVIGQPIKSDFSFFSALGKFNHTIHETEWTLIRKDTSSITVLLSITLLTNAKGDISGYLCVATDITARKKTEETLLQNTREMDKQNNLLNALVKTVPVGILMLEAPSQKPLIVNNFALHMLGMQQDKFAAMYPTYRFPSRTPYPIDELPMSLGMQGVNSRIDDLLVILPDGEERILQVTGTPVRDAEDQLWACVVCLVDITERSKETDEMSRLAYLDHLTQLPNRRLFYDRLQMAVIKAKREQACLALMSIDLDKFKPVNDNLGHAVGDILLQKVAERMLHCLRASDTLARIGGDEFAIILPDIINHGDALLVAEKIREALSKPFVLEGGHSVNIACCIGIAIYPDHGQEERVLMEHADEAMYEAKRLGRNCVRLAKESSVYEKPENEIFLLPMKWLPAYKSGDIQIDWEHRELFDRANELISIYTADKNQLKRMLDIVDNIIGSAYRHFTKEESLLAKLAYQELEEHVFRHQRLALRLQELRSQVASEDRPIGDLLLFIVRDIVREHIFKEDQRFFPLLRAYLQRTHSARDNPLEEK